MVLPFDMVCAIKQMRSLLPRQPSQTFLLIYHDYYLFSTSAAGEDVLMFGGRVGARPLTAWSDRPLIASQPGEPSALNVLGASNDSGKV